MARRFVDKAGNRNEDVYKVVHPRKILPKFFRVSVRVSEYTVHMGLVDWEYGIFLNIHIKTDVFEVMIMHTTFSCGLEILRHVSREIWWN